MKKRIFIVFIAIILVHGCIGTRIPNVDIKVDWKEVKGLIPLKANDMGTMDSRTIEVVVENKDRSYLEGITLKVSSTIPKFRITPQNAPVIALGPEGTSRTEPSIFSLETQNTAPGKYSFWIHAEYNGQIIESEKIDVDIE